MTHTEISIPTESGACPAHVFEPAGAGPWPAVLVYIDALGVRPAMLEIAERLAGAGYYTLMPDLLYRSGPNTTIEPARFAGDPAVRADWMSRVLGKFTLDDVMRDTAACLSHLEARAGATRVGVTGYCMGGRFAVAAAGHFPERVAAAAAYHPGNLAKDTPESPHHLAPRMRAEVYVAAASEDPTFPEDQKQRFAEAMQAAGVRHTLETYPARHGWVPSDSPVHDPAATERHWTTMLTLFDRALRPA